MTFAYVENGDVKQISSADVIEWGGFTIQGIRLLTPAERKERGIYDFIPAAAVPKYHRRGGATYEIDDVAGTVMEVLTIIPLDLEFVIGDRISELAAERFRRETAGIVVAGAEIKTDRESQAQLNGAFTSLQSGLILNTPWKAANGWVLVTLAEIQPIAQAVAAHVRACFANEQAHEGAIEAIALNATLTAAEQFEAVTAYDITTGWP